MSRPIISIEQLSKRYDLGVVGATTLRESLGRLGQRLRGQVGDTDARDFWALRDVSFDVAPGEVVGLVGRNGAGKSTLLKILSRITEPTSGRAVLRGRVASLLEVGTGFHPDLTGRENVFLNGAILGMKRHEIAARLDQIIAFAEVERFVDTPVKHYSSGMYVRLAFAVAAHLEPDVLIVDEVLAVGDASFQQKCMGKLGEVAGQGRTILLVSHNMSALQHVCTRCVLLQAGRVEKIGTPAEIVAQYLVTSMPTTNASLVDWPDRSGSGEGRITRLELVDGAGRPSAAFPIGAPIGFDLDLEFKEPVIDPCVGVAIHDSTGEPLLDLQSVHAGFRAGRVQGRVRIEGRLPNVQLYPGRYFVSPWITDAGVQRSIDFVRMCCSFQVLPAPGARGDLKLDPRWGKFWVDSDWRVRPERAPAAVR